MKTNRSSVSIGTVIALSTLLAPISWGTTYVTVTELLPPDRPLFVAAARVLPAGLLLLIIARLRTAPPAVADVSAVGQRRVVHTAVSALFNFVLFFPLLIVAVYRLPGGVAASFGGVQPLLVAATTWVVTGRRPRRLDLVVGAVAAVGVALVVIRPGATVDAVGVAAALVANIAFSIGVVLTKRFPAPPDRVRDTGRQLLISAIVIVPVALAVEGAPPDLSATNVVGFGYLSVVATGIAFVIWFSGIRRLPTQAPPVLGLAAPVTGALLGWIVLDQSLAPSQLLGFVITIAAVAYAATFGSAERSNGESDSQSFALRRSSADR